MRVAQPRWDEESRGPGGFCPASDWSISSVTFLWRQECDPSAMHRDVRVPRDAGCRKRPGRDPQVVFKARALAQYNQAKAPSPLPIPAGAQKNICARSVGKRSTGPFPVSVSPPGGRGDDMIRHGGPKYEASAAPPPPSSSLPHPDSHETPATPPPPAHRTSWLCQTPTRCDSSRNIPNS